MEQPPLFERLGGREGLHGLLEKVVANHFANPLICTRYENATASRDELLEGAFEFFCTGLSGVPTYTGKPLAEAHRGMNVSDQEFVAVIDDIMNAMNAHGVGDLEQAEALKILWGMKGDIVGL
jgi:hemoglobin